MKRRLNIVDYLLFALIALAAVVCILFLQKRNVLGEVETNPMAYTVEIREVRMDTIDLLVQGSDVFNSTDNKYLGKLEAFRYVPHVEYAYSEQQEAYFACGEPDSYDLYLTISGEGYETDSAVIISGSETRIGAELAVKGKGYAATSFVVEIDTAYEG
ncbi:MAG: DUF4330 domain-containing protein [Oscillospiraceae bacterium]|nr:DUF4330 domain-containing protein [Oscillospiraceae bacterium]